MKKYFLVLLTGSLMACGGNSGNSEQQQQQQEKPVGIAQEPAQTEAQVDGRQLIQNSDCKACHMDDARIIGPAYQEVAERYEANDSTITYLANKVIQGGSGNWGEVPMTPHPQHSQEEAEAMARYILSLNN